MAPIDKTYMGRVYLAPAPSQELYINIGWNWVNGQMYPEWMPIFEEAISKEEYDTLIGKIKSYLDENNLDPSLRSCGYRSAGCCCIGVCILCHLSSQTNRITNDVKKISEENAGACVAYVQNPTPTALTAEAMGVDQSGLPMIIWPPLGFNIILKAPATFDMRSVWPKPIGLAQVADAIVHATTTGVPVTAAANVADPAPVADVIVRETPAERLRTVEKLRDDGLITEDEFQVKRKEILDDV